VPEAHQKTEIKQVIPLLGGELLSSVGADACRLWSPWDKKAAANSSSLNLKKVKLESRQVLQPPKPSAPTSWSLEVHNPEVGMELWLATLSPKVHLFVWDAAARNFAPNGSFDLQLDPSMKPAEAFVTYALAPSKHIH
jgi:hypothetical protein